MELGLLEILIIGGSTGIVFLAGIGAFILKAKFKKNKAKNSAVIKQAMDIQNIKEAIISVGKHNGLLNSEAFKKLNAVEELDTDAIEAFMLNERAKKVALSDKKVAKTKKYTIK